jgi:uncharacterized protein DUF748
VAWGCLARRNGISVPHLALALDGGRTYTAVVTNPVNRLRALAQKGDQQFWQLPYLQSFSPRRRKLVRWALGLFLGYTILGFFILPPIIRAVAVKQLSKQFDREVSIRKLKLNPYALSVTIRGLLIKDQDGEPFVSWDEVYVNFQLSSFFGHPWVFREVSTVKPYVRVQINPDRTFNFSDLIAKFATNAAPDQPAAPSKPTAVRIRHLKIVGASASLTDLTLRTPFQRIVGPLDIDLEHFHTDPSSRNPYSFAGTTDAGERFAWSGHFYLAPLRSQGELSLENFSLIKYAPLYQDLVRFEIKDGIVDARSTYRFEMGASNFVAAVTNTSFRLRSFLLTGPGGKTNLAELPEFSVAGVSAEMGSRRAEVGSVTAANGRLLVQRSHDNTVNFIDLSQPAATGTNQSFGVLLLLRSVTNAVARLLDSTNAWQATVHQVDFTNCALGVEDLVNSRPVRLDLEEINFSARHISNLPGTNLTASLSLRWNTNGTVKTGIEASFLPPTVDLRLALDQITLGPLDPYMESKLNVFILNSKLSMNGRVQLRTTNAELPVVTFAGDLRLDDFSTVDGVLAEDLLKWSSVRISGIEANLNPPAVGIKEIAVDDVYARVVIETNGVMNLMTALRMGDTNAPAADAETEPAGKAAGKEPRPAADAASTAAAGGFPMPEISIATVVISNAQFRFTDRSLTPGVNLSVQQAGGTIAGLSSKDLQHADLDLHARVDNVGPVQITGTINPFQENLTNDVKISVKDVDLTPASPYVGKFAGYRLAKGKLNLTLAYHIHGRQLKSENIIMLDQFTFGEKVESPDATKLPVRLAVAILKDRNGIIELDVPIEGSLDDPAFRLRKVIFHAIGNIITKIATSPFAVLGALFGGKGEELSYQDFAPGSFELQPGGREKLDGLVKGLYERPSLQLDIEGSVDPTADRDGLRHAALEKQLRARKWMGLRKAEREATTAEQVTLSPDERLYWLKRAYGEASSRGELAPYNPNAQNTQPQTPAAPPRAGSAAINESAKGAVMLMQYASDLPPTAPGTTTASSAPPPKRTEAEEIEMRLLNSIAVSDADFQALAAARAKAVREYILQKGTVEADRIFLVESQPGGVKSQGNRAYLQLK